MKTLSVSALLLATTLSLSVQAEVKPGETFLLKQDIQAVKGDPYSILINGVENNVFKLAKINSTKNMHMCNIEFSSSAFVRQAEYQIGTEFEVKQVSARLSTFGNNGHYKGITEILLLEKGNESNGGIFLICETMSQYKTKFIATKKIAAPEINIETFAELFEHQK
jgi:hypothetical protein